MTDIGLSGFNVLFEEDTLFPHDLTWESNQKLNLISGFNGSGKTMLLKSLSYLSPTIFDSHSIKGEFILGGINQFKNKSYNSQFISYLPQANDIINIGSTVYNELSILSNRVKLDFDRYLNALKVLNFKYDIKELKSRPTSTFSRGEKQKLGLAFIDALNPNCIFYDEPDSFLDIAGQSGFVKLVKSQLEDSKIILIASHRANIYKGLNYSELQLSKSIFVKDSLKVISANGQYSKIILKLFRQQISITKSKSFLIDPIDISEGELIAVRGINGTGKSTFLKKLFHNELESQRNISQENIIFITEEPDNQLLYKNLDFEIKTFSKGKHYFDDNFIKQSLDIFGNKSRNIHTLSWGQRKYLLLLLAIASGANLLLLDEPFTGINGNLRISLYGLIDFAIKKGKTIILSANDSENLNTIKFNKNLHIH